MFTIPARFNSQARWHTVLNSSGIEIPAFSFVQSVGVSIHGDHTVTRPTAENKHGNIGCTGPVAIPAGKYGMVSFDFPLQVKYAGSYPAAGDIRGTAANSFQLTSGKKGFIVLGVDDTQGLAWVREFFFKDLVFFDEYATLDEASPATNFHNTGKDIYMSYAGGSDKEWMALSNVPFSKPRDIVIPSGVISVAVQDSGGLYPSGYERVWDTDIGIEFALLRVEPDLTAVTWNSHNRRDTSAFFAVAANWQDLGQKATAHLGFSISDAAMLVDPSTYVTTGIKDASGGSEGIKITLAPGSPLDDYTYYGIHIRAKTASTVSDVPAHTGSVTLVEGILGEASDPGDPLAYVILDDMGVVVES